MDTSYYFLIRSSISGVLLFNYIRLERVLQEVIHEESAVLKLQLELQHAENTKDKIREKLLEQSVWKQYAMRLLWSC